MDVGVARPGRLPRPSPSGKEHPVLELATIAIGGVCVALTFALVAVCARI